jgi:hypothetical protein
MNAKHRGTLMAKGITGDSSPKSNDLDGWKAAVAAGHLRSFRLESIAAAFQDLGNQDNGLRERLAKHLSDSILGILRPRVSYNQPNGGWDIVFRAHQMIFEALLRPRSADGRALREAFVPRVQYRLKDALADEAKERRVPDENASGGAIASEFADGSDGSDTRHQLIFASPPFDEIEIADEEIDVSRILACIPDARKRLAFRLFMDGVPFKTKKNKVTSIAAALGVSEKTARDWIAEVRDVLRNDERVQRLRKAKAGEII